MYAICYDNTVSVYSVDAIATNVPFQSIHTSPATAGRVLVHDTLGGFGSVTSP